MNPETSMDRPAEMPGYIDTHTHLYGPEFDDDRDAVVNRALAAGARKFFLPNCDEASLPAMLKMCNRYPGVCYPMLGLHPTELPPNPEPFMQKMESMLARQAASVDEAQVAGVRYIGIGEVGMDLYWDTSRKDEQTRVFARQVEWALRFNLPLMIHVRAAIDEVIDVLRPYRNTALQGVFHCFTGTAGEAARLLDFPHFSLGVGGVVTFKKGPLREALAQAVPLARLVLETDAPYMAPVPHRGCRNESSFLPFVIEKLSEVYGVTPSEVCRRTTQNALRLFPLACN